MSDFENQSIFTMFAEIVPESMKAKDSSLTASRKISHHNTLEASSSNSRSKVLEDILVPLPVTVLYARETRMLRVHHFSSDEITYKASTTSEVKLDISVKKDDVEQIHNENFINDSDEDTDTCCDDSRTKGNEKGESEVHAGDIDANNNNDESDSENVQSETEATKNQAKIDSIPKVTLETIRRRIVMDWPELTKERTKMDYDANNNVVIPIVYSGTKGVV